MRITQQWYTRILTVLQYLIVPDHQEKYDWLLQYYIYHRQLRSEHSTTVTLCAILIDLLKSHNLFSLFFIQVRGGHKSHPCIPNEASEKPGYKRTYTHQHQTFYIIFSITLRKYFLNM